MTRQDPLCAWLQTLSPREEYVLRSRFGIGAHAGDLGCQGAFTASLSAEQLQHLESRGLRQLRRALPTLAEAARRQGAATV